MTKLNKNPDKTIKDTGERMVPAYHKSHMVYGEHIVRYQAAAPLVKDKIVLDIASGSGYGSHAISKFAKQVIGVDINVDAVAYAKKNYGSKNVVFIKGDGIKIPLEDNSVDVVISFETIEHIEDYHTFMTEIKRVLKKDGLFILSTPNDVEFPESNHFHIHEFEQKELESLVAKFFKNTTSYFQATWLYNALLPESLLSKEWEQSITTLQTAPITIKKAIYFYMLCSNRELNEKIEPLAAISEHWSARSTQEYETSIRKFIDEQAVIITSLKNSNDSQAAELKNLQARLERIYNSKSWKALQKLVRAKRKLKP